MASQNETRADYVTVKKVTPLYGIDIITVTGKYTPTQNVTAYDLEDRSSLHVPGDKVKIVNKRRS